MIVVPAPAASLIVLRDGPLGREVLMGQRGATASFMPSRVVFPGGRVDPEDFAAEVGAPLRASVRARLQVSADAALAHALGVAGARELTEEAGLSLGAPPRLDALAYLCRAVTPASSPKRFDARFFVLDAHHLEGTLGGSGELSDLAFLPIDRALALDLALVTRAIMHELLEWLALTPEARDARPPRVLEEPAWRVDDGRPSP